MLCICINHLPPLFPILTLVPRVVTSILPLNRIVKLLTALQSGGKKACLIIISIGINLSIRTLLFYFSSNKSSQIREVFELNAGHRSLHVLKLVLLIICYMFRTTGMDCRGITMVVKLVLTRSVHLELLKKKTRYSFNFPTF